jgi:muconolactone delta-isomerase
MARDDAPHDLDAAERAEALDLIARGQTVRVWRAGRILVLSSRADVDAVWPPKRRSQSTRAVGDA